jgi:ribonuclease HI
MNLHLPFPTSPRLLIQLVRLLGDVFWVQVLRIGAHNTSHRHKTNVDVLAMQGIQRQHKRALSRLDHRKRCQLRDWFLVELGGACDEQRGQAGFGCLLQQWDGPFRGLVEANVREL